MKGIIIYKSKYGSTRMFAMWLNEELKFDLLELDRDMIKLDSYNIVILGTSIHGGKISLHKFVKKNYEILFSKELIIMLTSGTSDPRFIKSTIERSLPKELIEKVKVFPVGGRYLFNRMTTLDRTLIKIVSFFTKDKNTKAGMLKERDDVKKENLAKLLSYLHEIQ